MLDDDDDNDEDGFAAEADLEGRDLGVRELFTSVPFLDLHMRIIETSRNGLGFLVVVDGGGGGGVA